MDATTKQTIPPDLVQEMNTQASNVLATPTAVPKKSSDLSRRDTLLRLKRQLALENELSSAADESENLGIEQVCCFRSCCCFIDNNVIKLFNSN